MIVAIIMISKQKELSRTLKSFVIGMLLLTIALAAIYEYSSHRSQKASQPIVLAFKHGKTLLCKEKEISQKSYSYEPGTSAFQPRFDVVGPTFSVTECAIHP
jgi:hypothetical protein